MAFNPAIELEIKKRKTRIYVLRGNSLFQPSEPQLLIDHVKKVFESNNSILDHGIKHVLLVWSVKNVPMIDWWIWGDKESESEGSAIEVYLFRESERYDSPLVTAEDGIKILAGEAN